MCSKDGFPLSVNLPSLSQIKVPGSDFLRRGTSPGKQECFGCPWHKDWGRELGGRLGTPCLPSFGFQGSPTSAVLIKASLAGCLWPQSHTALGGCPWASQPLPGWGTNDCCVWGTRYLLSRVHTSSQRFRGTRLPWAPKYVLNGSPGEPQLEPVTAGGLGGVKSIDGGTLPLQVLSACSQKEGYEQHLGSRQAELVSGLTQSPR